MFKLQYLLESFSYFVKLNTCASLHLEALFLAAARDGS